MENLKNVAPIEDFNWDAYENGETVTNVSHDELEKAYDGTLRSIHRKPGRQKRTARSVTQKSPRYSFLGSR